MSFRFPTLVAFSILFAVPTLARGEVPSTTDEARALAGARLPAQETPRPVPPGTIVSTTDEARALAGRMLPRSQPAPIRTIQAVGSTDEARAVAGGLLVVAPATQKEKVASCGRSCSCGHPG